MIYKAISYSVKKNYHHTNLNIICILLFKCFLIYNFLYTVIFFLCSIIKNIFLLILVFIFYIIFLKHLKKIKTLFTFLLHINTIVNLIY
mmetsp:Transcript_19435/g.36597  ORF Transcript_19435/g.36597 Transcript_19435/m.36597 type:complete len:89 (+) Transcript_19435:540-806(+)